MNLFACMLCVTRTGVYTRVFCTWQCLYIRYWRARGVIGLLSCSCRRTCDWGTTAYCMWGSNAAAGACTLFVDLGDRRIIRQVSFCSFVSYNIHALLVCAWRWRLWEQCECWSLLCYFDWQVFFICFWPCQTCKCSSKLKFKQFIDWHRRMWSALKLGFTDSLAARLIGSWLVIPS